MDDPLEERLHADREHRNGVPIGANARCDKTRFVPLPPLNPLTLPVSHFIEAEAEENYSRITFVYSNRVVVVEGERLEGLLSRFEANQLRMVEQVIEARDAVTNELYVPEGRFAVTSIRYEEPGG